MKLTIWRIVTAGLVAITSLAMAITPMAVNAATDCTNSVNASKPVCLAQSGVNETGGQGATSFEENFTNIINAILYLLGAIAVIMIIIGGVRYTVSGGDSSAVSGAKNTILYAVIGLVVAIMAYAIVNFVTAQF